MVWSWVLNSIWKAFPHPAVYPLRSMFILGWAYIDCELSRLLPLWKPNGIYFLLVGFPVASLTSIHLVFGVFCDDSRCRYWAFGLAFICCGWGTVSHYFSIFYFTGAYVNTEKLFVIDRLLICPSMQCFKAVS